MSNPMRSNLGDFSSIVCFKAAIAGMEEVLGEDATAVSLSSAGRARGKKLADDLGLVGKETAWDTITEKVGHALGKDGTCLCLLEKIVEEGEVIKVYTSETLCSAGEPQGSSRRCSFTLGVIWGVLEKSIGKRLQGKQVESVLRGGSYDTFEFKVLF